MVISLISDLHLDFFETRQDYAFLKSLPSKGVDYLLIAGDTGEFRKEERIKEWFNILSDKYKDVVFITGNHEYYKSYPWEVEDICRKLENTFCNVKYLNNKTVYLDDNIRLHGGTMWFKNDPGNVHYEVTKGFSDFCYINRATPWIYEQNAKFTKLLEGNLKSGDLILTHHAPSSICIDEKFYDSDLNRFFVSNMEKFIVDMEPSYWLHGHMHTPMEKQIHKTKIICNPLGYPRERNPNGYQQKLIEII